MIRNKRTIVTGAFVLVAVALQYRPQSAAPHRASAPPFLLRPPLQNARSLPDRYPNRRPVLDGVGKDFLRLAKIIAGIKQAIDFHAVLRPLFDLVEIATVRDQRVASGFLILSQCA